MQGRVKSIRAPVGEEIPEFGHGSITGDELRQYLSLYHVLYDNRLPCVAGMTERRSRLLMLWLAVNHNGVIRRREFRCAIPDFFHERARRIVLFDVDANLFQFCLQFQGGSKSRNQHNIVRY